MCTETPTAVITDLEFPKFIPVVWKGKQRNTLKEMKLGWLFQKNNFRWKFPKTLMIQEMHSCNAGTLDDLKKDRP